MDLLAGIKVVSFNHFLAGPLGAQILADLGADVIALEPPEGAFHRNWAVANHFVGGQSVNFLSTGRNKRSLSVDLKSTAGREVVARLLREADVVMENFRPGTMGKLGLDYETLRETNPRLIYAAAYGYGSSGPYTDRPGQDLLLQALSGLAARTGRADGPPTPVGAVVVDQHAAMIYAMAILAALFARERTGKGRLVEVNLFQAALDLQTEALTAWMNGARAASPRGPGGIASWFSGGPYGIYATADGHLALSMSPPGSIGQALEVPELAAMGESDAFARREDIARLVTERLKQRPTAEWLPGLERQKIWHAPMQDYGDLQADPQLQHLGAFITTDGATGHPVTLVSHPARYDGEVPRVRLVPQPLGAQSRDILAELGFTPDEMETMKRGGAVNWPEASA
ncbi:CaiB/BaiF CoA transferase family protein [Muricoccus pecuniae]|uniref:Crotonobetainyl-CoA:carnitine CoA-transferase CaiB-like acyl-CoA transferase n=1 Tax=Muricoccus pecuniae TaxID=693023 RepID=A0A840YLC0_9PROT|nr:CoA transferase [Roseomonas pecuniae]MBB5695453.1 crotonobetainyl-CoA:carnitine CoA-transferase CaiB-like acyl-CoA transferase [Roseomonas pecuniae]